VLVRPVHTNVVSRFEKANLLIDTRVVQHESEVADEASSLVESLQCVSLTEEALQSDDGVDSSSESENAH
jgi:hypothetical protein